MARKNTLLVALTSFVIVLLLIALVKFLFPRSVMGFTDMSCYGVVCQEGEFCQSGGCKKIYPQETNNYYDEGVEGFQDSCPPGTKKNEKGDCQAVEGFANSLSAGAIAFIVIAIVICAGGAYVLLKKPTPSTPTPTPMSTSVGGRR